MTLDLTSGSVLTGDHVVQFYEHEADLIGVVGPRLARAARAHETSIVIATEAHRAAFVAELELAGIDVAEARRTGLLVMVDAAATLGQFMAAGELDRDAFRSVIGGILGRAIEAGRPVQVYGEMVALLWAAGAVLAAIELESWWNDLGESLPFSLLCAYPSASVAGPKHAEALQRVCHLHSSVVPSPTQVSESAEFSPDRQAPGAARRFVRDSLRKWGHADDDLLDDATLVISELASNAVLHAGSVFSVEIRIRPADQVLQLSVRDAGPLDPPLVAVSGRGLGIVAGLASRWGVAPAAGAKVVWTELALART